MTVRRVLRLIYLAVSLLREKVPLLSATFICRGLGGRATGNIGHIFHSAASPEGSGDHTKRIASDLRGGGLGRGDRRNQSESGYSGQTTWIQNFCRTPGNEFFAEVPESFIRESMNLIDIGRGVEIPNIKEALGVLLGETRVSTSIHGDASQKASMVQSSAALLYGLLHARFLVSPQGLKVALEKFSKADYGRCPRVFCQGQAVLPVGETDRPMQSSVRVFCPRCGDLYYPSGYVRACDGAFWGTTLPHLLLLGWPELKTEPNAQRYVPRVYGFRVHAEASQVSPANARDHTTNKGRANVEHGVAGPV